MIGISPIKGSRVLVTGASGFIGQHVLAFGLANGVEIHALSRKRLDMPDVSSWCGEICDEKWVTRVITEVRPDGILHLAAGGVAYGSSTTTQLLQVNVLGLAGVLEAVANLNLQASIVIAGSGFEYAHSSRPLKETDPIGPTGAYGVSKSTATFLAGLYASRFPVTVLRLFSLYGPGEKAPRLTPFIIDQVKNNRPVELTAGEQLRDYTFVSDVAEAFWRAFSNPPEDHKLRVLNTASGNAITLRHFIEVLADELRRRGLPADLRFGAKNYRPDEPMNYMADVSLIREVISWIPVTPLADGIARMVEASL